ncbi:hypothetical protein ACFQX7_37075 [Luedemannella flava]
MLAEARTMGARRIETVVLAANADGLAFAVRRGFVEFDRYVVDDETAEFVDLYLKTARAALPMSRSSRQDPPISQPRSPAMATGAGTADHARPSQDGDGAAWPRARSCGGGPRQRTDPRPRRRVRRTAGRRSATPGTARPRRPGHHRRIRERQRPDQRREPR